MNGIELNDIKLTKVKKKKSTNKIRNKWIHILLIILPATLAGGVFSVVSILVVSFINSKNYRQLGMFPYNELVTDFSKSDDALDQFALKSYQDNTVSLQFTSGNNLWHYGTAWFWKSESNLSYFATNLHVIDDLLVYTPNSSLPYQNRFSLRGETTQGNANTNYSLHYQTYNRPVTFPNENPTFKNVKLAKINVFDNKPEIAPAGKHLYSDLVVFSTTTALPQQKALDFIDTDDEINYVIRNLSDLTFYISGFPFHNEPIWTTGKYKWSADNNMKYYDTPPRVSTARSIFGSNYFNTSYGLNLNAVNLPSEDKHHYSYSRQIILPGLNFEGGSSGSLVTVWNPSIQKLQALGIYWGVYHNKINNDPNNIYYAGSLDLFFSGNYYIGGSPFEYNNTKW